MSLKQFHIIFIVVSSLFMVYFAYWSINKWMEYADNAYMFYFILSALSFAGLIFYSRKFLKKYKGLVS